MRRIPFGHVTTQAVTQAYRRLATDLGGPMRSINLRAGKTEPFHAISLPPPYCDKASGEALLKGHFVYCEQRLDVGMQGDPWTLPAPSERFAFWLHSFTWLENLSGLKDKGAKVRARFLIDRWIDVYGKWNPYTWDNDIIANRLFAWLSVWSDTLSTDSLSDLAYSRRANIIRQLRRLRSTYKRTPLGLPKLKAAAVMVLGGLYMTDKSDGFFGRGMDWLSDEIVLQIFSDGGHISRSPNKSLEALEILSRVEAALEIRGVSSSKELQRAVERLRHIIPFFQATDGGLVCFNGTGEGIKPRIAHLTKSRDFEARPFVYCPHSGYHRVEQGGTVILVDTGETSPLGYDQEAHLAPLAIEISTDAGRMIVNCGWSEEQPVTWRQIMRSTAAHSTLTLQDKSAGQIIKDGFKSNVLGKIISEGIDDTVVTRKDQAAGVWLEMSHNGYVNSTGLSHRRRLYVKNDGRDIRGEDSLLVPLGGTPQSRDQVSFDIRFHLHPSVRATLAQDLQSALLIQSGHAGWRFRTDGGPMRIEESVYLGNGCKPVKTQQIVISGKAFADSDGETKSNRVRWSMRRLEIRS